MPLPSREFLVLSWATPLLRKEGVGHVLVSPFGLWVFLCDLVISRFCGVRFADIRLFSGLAPSMYFWLVDFSSIECQPTTTPLWSLILNPH